MSLYGECHGVCNFVVSSVVEICVDYGGVYVFHVCFVCCVGLVCGVFFI